MKKISVIGAGSWGTTLAVLLGEKGFDVKLWTRREELANEIESSRENKQYLPGIKIPSNVIAEHSLGNCIESSELIITAVPSEFLRNVMEEIKPYFKLYQLNDVAGVEICGSLKNISAIATGVCDGLGFGDNARASIITLGLMEMNNFGRHFGAKRGTVYGLAGVGDLIATCTSRHSRNRFVGEQLAKGKSMQEIKKEMHGMIAEGIPTTKAVYEHSKKHDIEMPLTQQVYEVLFENKNIRQAVKDLLSLV